MSKLVWDADGQRFYETGVSHGVFYPKTQNGAYTPGVAWNGLTGVTESPSGAEPTDLWADDMKYLTLRSSEQFGFTIEAYTYPDEFEACNGTVELAPGVKAGQQPRKAFGFCYRTVVGNDIDYDDHGYIIHLVYNATVSPSEKSYATINDSPEAITFSWEGTTNPMIVEGLTKAVAKLDIDSRTAVAAKLAALEAILHGADEFSAAKTYAVGDIVEHTTGEGTSAVTKAYVCSTEVSTAGDWDSSSWTEIAEAGPRLPLPTEIKTLMQTA